MFCKYCGNRIKETDRVCPCCGREREPMQASLELKQLLRGKLPLPEAPEDAAGGKPLSGERREEKALTERNREKQQQLEKRQRTLEKQIKRQGLFLKVIAVVLVLLLVVTAAVSCSLSGAIRDMDIQELAGQVEAQNIKLEELERSMLQQDTEAETERTTENAAAEETVETKTESETEAKTQPETNLETQPETQPETRLETENSAQPEAASEMVTAQN